LYNCVFGLSSTERREGYDFLLTSIDSIRQEIHAEKPKVATTDFEEGLRSSIQETWPDTQLQLCIFHINQNITSNAKKKGLGAGGPPSDEFDVARDKEAAEAEALNNQARIDEVLSRGQLPEEAVDHTVSGFCSLWAYVIYAKSEEDFDAAWARLQKEFDDQQPLLEYIRTTYIPLRYQWATCFISQYENFGVRTNSPTETAHKDIKSYVINGNTDLHSLSQALEEMIRNKSRSYTQSIAEQENKVRRRYLGQEWLGQVSKEVG
jgi:hypothetical protein